MQILLARSKKVVYICNVKQKILQYFADNLIKNLQMSIESNDTETFEFFMMAAVWYESFCFNVFSVELN